MVRWKDISVIMITLNAEKSLNFSLRSVSQAGECILVDGGSRDRTVEIARSYGCKVIHHPFRSFVEQKTIALNEATRPWVLNLDADERISEKLSRCIEATDPPEDVTGYRIPFIHFLWGKALRYGGWQRDKKIRLVRREEARIRAGGWFVHEALDVRRGKVENLPYPILHNSYPDLEDVMKKLDLYSRLGAYDLYLKGVKSTRWHRYILPLAVFIQRYILQGGFLDGPPGFWAARIRAWSVALKYWRLWEIQKGFTPPPELPPVS